MSLAAHAGLGLALGLRCRVPLEIEPVSEEAGPERDREAEPTVVTLVTLAGEEPAGGVASMAAGETAVEPSRDRRRERRGHGPGARSSAPGPGPRPGPVGGAGISGALRMRTRGPLDLTVRAPPPTRDVLPGPRPADRRRRGLRSRTDLGVTVARTDPFGRVKFEDRPGFEMHLDLPTKKGLAMLIDSWLADPYGHASRMGARPETNEAPDTRRPPEQSQGKNTVLVPGIAGGSFDVTDVVMRAVGQDPYASKKLAFLDATRDERAGIARRREAVDLTDAVAGLRRHLEALWRRGDLDARRRRAVLFELWDECAERGTKDELAAAEQARATIVGFIRRRLPAGSAAAYPTAELEALNRRRTSHRRFAPYDR